MALTRSMRRRTGAALTAPSARQGMRRRTWVKRYKPSDTAHRHRLSDTQPKEEEVSGYRRRK